MTNALNKKNYLKWNLIPWHAVPCFARFVRFNYKIWFLFTVFLIEAYWISIAFVMAEIACIVRSKLIPLCMLVHRLIALFFVVVEWTCLFFSLHWHNIDRLPSFLPFLLLVAIYICYYHWYGCVSLSQRLLYSVQF